MKGASLVAQRVKCLPAMWETWVRSPGWEDPLEKEMAAHSRTVAWKIAWREEPWDRKEKQNSRDRNHMSGDLGLEMPHKEMQGDSGSVRSVLNLACGCGCEHEPKFIALSA